MLYSVCLVLSMNFKHVQIKLFKAVKILLLVEKKREALQSKRIYLMKIDFEMNTQI